MPAPSTVVVLRDEDGDEFPILLPGVYRDNRGADIAAALQLLNEQREQGAANPRGEVVCDRIEWKDDFVD